MLSLRCCVCPTLLGQVILKIMASHSPQPSPWFSLPPVSLPPRRLSCEVSYFSSHSGCLLLGSRYLEALDSNSRLLFTVMRVVWMHLSSELLVLLMVPCVAVFSEWVRWWPGCARTQGLLGLPSPCHLRFSPWDLALLSPWKPDVLGPPRSRGVCRSPEGSGGSWQGMAPPRACG